MRAREIGILTSIWSTHTQKHTHIHPGVPTRVNSGVRASTAVFSYSKARGSDESTERNTTLEPTGDQAKHWDIQSGPEEKRCQKVMDSQRGEEARTRLLCGKREHF